MSDLRFDVEWHDGTGIKGPELAATFGSFRMAAAGAVLTQVEDHRARTLRETVHVPLYPLAEWLASNWWFLAHEAQNRVNSADPAWAHRHCLVTGAEGYAFPDVRFSAAGRRVCIDWRGRASVQDKLEFRGSGSIVVDRDDFLRSCSELIGTVARRLEACGVASTHLHDEWAAIHAADDDEMAFCETAAGLGRDPYDIDDETERLILRVGESLGELRQEALPAINGSAPLAACAALDEAMAAARPHELRLSTHLLRAGSRMGAANEPWQEGYELARELRGSLGLNGELIADTAMLADAVGQEPAALERIIRPIEPLQSLSLVDGVMHRRSHDTASFGLRAYGETGRRFQFCRALAEALTTDADALITKARTERQQRNRAFAAEFLAPSSGLRERIPGHLIDTDQVTDLAEEFGVATYVIEHQVENHRIAEVVGDESRRVW